MRKHILLLLLVLHACKAPADDFEGAVRLLWAGQIDKAIAELRAIGQQGDVRAQVMLGRIYCGSMIPKADFDEAIKWFRLAASHGSGEASAAIADLLDEGRGVAKDEKAAAEWYEKASAQGWDQQELTLTALKWKPAAGGALLCQADSPSQICPNPDDMDLLREAGLHGVLKPDGGMLRNRRGPKDTS